MNIDQIDRRIRKIDHQLVRDDPALGKQFAQLGPVSRRHDAAVFTLLVFSAVFLMIGLATMSVVAWLVGVASFVASFSVDMRYERRLRVIRRSSELSHCFPHDRQLRTRRPTMTDRTKWR